MIDYGSSTGFFVDIELFSSKEGELQTALVADMFQTSQTSLGLHSEPLADETEHLMLKLKFLPYKVKYLN